MPLPMGEQQRSLQLLNLIAFAFSYQSTPVLNQVSFQVYPGEFIGIIGPNGGGKTTSS